MRRRMTDRVEIISQAQERGRQAKTMDITGGCEPSLALRASTALFELFLHADLILLDPLDKRFVGGDR